MENRDWLLKRNCSLSPRQTVLAYGTPCAVSFAVAIPFTLHGAWYVLAFVFLETGALAAAFFHYARHATDHEHIVLMDGLLLIETVEAGELRQTRLDPYWTRVMLPREAEDMIFLEAKGIKVQIGRFVTDDERRKVAKELLYELRGGQFIPAS